MIDFCIMKNRFGTSHVVGSFGVQQCHLLSRLWGGGIFVNAAIPLGYVKADTVMRNEREAEALFFGGNSSALLFIELRTCC